MKRILRKITEESVNRKANKKHILQDTIFLLEQYEDGEDILYKLQEDYQLSNDEATEYLQKAEEIFLEKFNENDDNEPNDNQIKSDEEINTEHKQAKRVLGKRHESD
jgi:hypothetical protein